jgi:small GTP-binding protein
MFKTIVFSTFWISVPTILSYAISAWRFSVICPPHHHSLLLASSSSSSVESRCFSISNPRLKSFRFSRIKSAVLFSTSREEGQKVETSNGLLDSANVDVKEDSETNPRTLIEELDQKFSYQGRMKPQHKEHNQQPQDVGRFGYIGLVGAPNMGKSTLLNALIGEELCVASRRPQTTRHAILGILTEQNVQLAFLDTPGVIENPSYLLQEGMMEAVKGALNDADVILLVTDIFSTPLPDDDLFAKIQHLSSSGAKPVIVAVNKVDMLDKVMEKRKRWEHKHKQEADESSTTKGVPIVRISSVEQEDDEDTVDYVGTTTDNKTYSVEDAVLRWRMLLPNAVAIIPLVATDPNHAGVRCLRTLLCGISDVPESIRNLGRPIPGMFREGVKFISNQESRSLLPVGPPLYEEDALTDRSERFFASEMIRAAIFEEFQKEIPYCTEVQVTEFKEAKQQQQQQRDNGENNKNSILRLSATIFVERESQKGILVGTGGKQIKKVGIRARKSLESFFQSKVHLDLRVKVDKDWRSKEDKLKKFGYIKK